MGSITFVFKIFIIVEAVPCTSFQSSDLFVVVVFLRNNQFGFISIGELMSFTGPLAVMLDPLVVVERCGCEPLTPILSLLLSRLSFPPLLLFHDWWDDILLRLFLQEFV